MSLARWLRRIEDAVLVTALAAMVLLAVAQILVRNAFDSGFSWGDPALRVLVLWTALLGAVVGSRDDRHIRIDLLMRFLPARARVVTLRMTWAATAALSAPMAWWSARFVADEHQFGPAAFTVDLFAGASVDVPAWACEAIIPLAFALIALRYARLAIVGPPP